MGEPIPWFTYPTIDFLLTLDFSGKTVFEFGGGNSTRFWAKRAKSVLTVETDSQWYERLASLNLANVTVTLANPTSESVVEVLEQQGKFDVIVIDGATPREFCTRKAIAHLNAGGVIVLDNSDICRGSQAYLRSAELLGIDFVGLGPLLKSPWMTSVYFCRDFDFGRLDVAFNHSPILPEGW